MPSNDSKGYAWRATSSASRRFFALTLAFAGSTPLAQECVLPASEAWTRGLAGEWEAVVEGGRVVGVISMREIEGACAYLEEVREPDRDPSTVIHSWDQNRDRWTQTAHGRRIDFDFVLRGALAAGSLAYLEENAVLSHDASSNDRDDCCFYQRRGTLRGIGGETLRQQREISLDEGATWSQLPVVEYLRIKPPHR